MESELAVLGRFRRNRCYHHQALSRSHRGGCEELPLCAEAQEVNLSMLHAERSSAICFLLLELNVESVGISMLPNND
ncbi:hypothetical protein LOK49_LG10G01921 [Camellia lanceoleosa]|uniref:Uncharacterized protein n=1 Tax=Camellia lanceoleosa TaxID=1840588 RepID=A0ACC0GCY4_9ERIC|nr:hypothetical protein LOK49_LG10G01921 [Camellia lanceoleosa]